MGIWGATSHLSTKVMLWSMSTTRRPWQFELVRKNSMWTAQLQVESRNQKFCKRVFKNRTLERLFGFVSCSRDQDLELLFDMAMSDYQPLCLGYESWSLVKFTLSDQWFEWFACFMACLYYFHIFSHVLTSCLIGKGMTVTTIWCCWRTSGTVWPCSMCLSDMRSSKAWENPDRTWSSWSGRPSRPGSHPRVAQSGTWAAERSDWAWEAWEASKCWYHIVRYWYLSISFLPGIMYSGIRSTQSRWWPQCVNWAVRRTKQQNH